MSLRAQIYRSMETPHTVRDLHEFTKKRGIHVSWIVEAGCHDASDIETLATLFKPDAIYAFEPDPIAFEIAKNRISSLVSQGHAIKLSNLALMSFNGDGGLAFVGHPGGGSTQIRDTAVGSEENPVQIGKFDDLEIPETSSGLLWLDVEGNAISALQGMQESLSKFKIAKIEVEFHDMSLSRIQNFQEVISLMKRSNFKVVKSDIRPGFFGDLLFVTGDQLNFMDSLKSALVTWSTYFLHGFLYPTLKKPK